MKRVIKASATNDSVFVWDGNSKVPRDVVNVRIEDSVTSIGDIAFSNCVNLTSVKIPDSVTSIGEMAFYNCVDLTSITIPDSVTSIGPWAFASCKGLQSVTISNSVTTIGNRVFYDCTNLQSVTIGDSVKSISNSAFDGCSRLDESSREAIKRISPDITFEEPKKAGRRVSKFSKMKKQLNAGEIENLCYDSEYSEYIDSLYGQATDKLNSDYSELYIEPSVQAGRGGVFAWYEADGVTYRTHWDYESECEAIEDMIADCKNDKELVDAIARYIDSHLEDAEPSDDSDHDDDDDLATL